MKLFFRALCALLLTAATARAIPVSLRVVDADGRPIANARASVVDYANQAANFRQTPVATKMSANAEGQIALDLRGAPRSDRSADIGDFAPAELHLGAARISAPGYGSRDLELLAGDNVIALGAPAHLSGVVRDDAGAPIARATVELLGVEPDETYNSRDRALAPMFGLRSATTRDDGSWELRELPPGYAYIVAHAPNREAHYGQLWIASGDNRAEPLDLAPAGAITGRILDRDGKPLAGVSVDSTDYDDPQSDAEGKFRVSNVPLGETTLEFASSSAAWLGMDEEIKTTVPVQGAVVDVGDVKMGGGLLLSGTIRDQSGAALPDLELRADEKTFRTDANGHFEARVAKPFYSLQIVRDYRKIADTPDVPDDATQFDLGEIKVERAFNWPLDIRDEAGNAAPQATLKFMATDRTNTTNSQFFTPIQRYLTTDGEGAFVPSLPASTYKIEGQGLWGVVAPQNVTITAPAPGEKPAPLKIVVRAFAPTRATGRVVDEKGAPIARARVQIKSKQGYASVLVFSGADGTWNAQFADFAAEPAFDKAEFAAYNFVRGGEMTREGEGGPWKSADIVMARTDIALAGRVVDANGVAVAGARVSWQDNPKFDFAATDSKGNFEMKNVPVAPFTLVASDGSRFAQTKAPPGTPVDVQLPPAKTPLSSEQLDALWGEINLGNLGSLWNLDDDFDLLGAARIYRVASRMDAGADPTRIGYGLSTYLQMRASHARTDAERFDVAVEGVELLRAIPMSDVSGEGAATIAVLAARTDDVELRQWAASWYDSRQPRIPKKLDPSYYSDQNLINTEFRMSAVGAVLGRVESEKYRADGLTLMHNYSNGEPRFYLTSWGELLWTTDAQRFDEALELWPKTERMALIVGALKTVDDAATAKLLWGRLEKLGVAAEVLGAEAEEKKIDQYGWSRRRDWLQEGRLNYARAVAAVDAPSALSALEEIGNAPAACAIALTIARAAIADGRDEIARRALRVGLSGNYSNTEGTFALAMVARDFDASIAEQLLARFRQSTLSQESARTEATRNQGWRNVAAYAFTLSEFDAGTGRLLLEDQWAKRRTAPPAVQSDYESWAAINEQQNLAWAMAIYDLPRALQWLGEIKDERDQYNSRLELTRVAILTLALATSSQRPILLAHRSFS